MSRELLPARFVPIDLIAFVKKIVSSPGSSESQIRRRIRNPKSITYLKRGALLFNLIEESDDRLRSTELGERLVSVKGKDCDRALLRDIVLGFEPYSVPLAQMIEDSAEAFSIASPEIKKYWTEVRKLRLSKDSLDKAVNTFFKLLEYAGIGAFWTGRHGKPTRLELTEDGFGLLKDAFGLDKGGRKREIAGGRVEMPGVPGLTEMPAIAPPGEAAPEPKAIRQPTLDKDSGTRPEPRYQVHRSKDGSVVLYIEPTERSIRFLELLIPVLKHEAEEKEE